MQYAYLSSDFAVAATSLRQILDTRNAEDSCCGIVMPVVINAIGNCGVLLASRSITNAEACSRQQANM